MREGRWSSPSTALKENLLQDVTVFGHFHIGKIFDDKFSELRRQLYHEATDKLQKQVMKGTRWLLLKNPEKRDRIGTKPNGCWRHCH